MVLGAFRAWSWHDLGPWLTSLPGTTAKVATILALPRHPPAHTDIPEPQEGSYVSCLSCVIEFLLPEAAMSAGPQFHVALSCNLEKGACGSLTKIVPGSGSIRRKHVTMGVGSPLRME